MKVNQAAGSEELRCAVARWELQQLRKEVDNEREQRWKDDKKVSKDIP